MKLFNRIIIILLSLVVITDKIFAQNYETQKQNIITKWAQPNQYANIKGENFNASAAIFDEAYQQALKDARLDGDNYSGLNYQNLFTQFKGLKEKMDNGHYNKIQEEVRKKSQGSLVLLPDQSTMVMNITFPFITPKTDILQVYRLLYGMVNDDDAMFGLLNTLNNSVLLYLNDTDKEKILNVEKGDGRTFMKLYVADKAQEQLDTSYYSFNELDKKRLQLLVDTFADLKTNAETDVFPFTIEELQTFRDKAKAIEMSPLSYGRMVKNALKVNAVAVGTGLGALALYNYADPVKQFVDQTMPFAGRLATAATNKLTDIFSWSTLDSIHQIAINMAGKIANTISSVGNANILFNRALEQLNKVAEKVANSEDANLLGTLSIMEDMVKEGRELASSIAQKQVELYSAQADGASSSVLNNIISKIALETEAYKGISDVILETTKKLGKSLVSTSIISKFANQVANVGSGVFNN